MNAYDPRLNSGTARPPEGDDYEALRLVATAQMGRVFEEAVARSNAVVTLQVETDPTTEQASGPRG